MFMGEVSKATPADQEELRQHPPAGAQRQAPGVVVVEAGGCLGRCRRAEFERGLAELVPVLPGHVAHDGNGGRQVVIAAQRHGLRYGQPQVDVGGRDPRVEDVEYRTAAGEVRPLLEVEVHGRGVSDAETGPGHGLDEDAGGAAQADVAAFELDLPVAPAEGRGHRGLGVEPAIDDLGAGADRQQSVTLYAATG